MTTEKFYQLCYTDAQRTMGYLNRELNQCQRDISLAKDEYDRGLAHGKLFKNCWGIRERHEERLEELAREKE